ncbi:Presequence protease; mitochondrial [Camelus dromedarius]|uniref:Presequence protease, mitochondrial n=1 Tax=Camelus dromedarius TaxID=9838 RepID=A0A5N4C4K4_CAMDR|nr:Presequence protease; mitochondrial [Camelus dromedarius]
MWRSGWRASGALRRLGGRSANLRAWRWGSTTACERALRFQVGEKIQGFTVGQVTSVPELCLTAVKLSHDGTGARYLHLAREDRNNLFSVQFRTTPVDSSGVPHVLEHTVLCGSRKYPCRDPFFKMLNRSLSTFMNAFTASDYTLYPFSTQNPKDFQNLLSVYLDAVFFPCLRELDFWQEGWRLEHEDPNDPQTPLVFKGVVFNEMKGAFADNERTFSQHLQSRLLPDHTYAVVSGGDPLCIPDLTWEQLRQFHATHYHPSNARFFTYGDFPLEQHLKQIHEEALSKFEKIEPRTAVPAQRPWPEPREFQITCARDSLAAGSSEQTTVSVSFLLPDITNTFEAFTLSLLSSLLISGPNSPFYKALVESGLGTDFSPDAGYNGCTREAYFSVGLQGIAEKDIQTVRDLVDRTLDDVILYLLEQGFEDDRIEALLHKVEIQMKHQSASFGLALASVFTCGVLNVETGVSRASQACEAPELTRSPRGNVQGAVTPLQHVASCWNHDGDPVECLKLGSQVARFRQCLEENPKFLQEKLKQYFKDNRHKLILSMKPDDQYAEKQAQVEAEKLKQKVDSLSPEDKQRIYEKGLELQTQQSRPQDASCLPALKVSDIEPRIPVTELDVVWRHISILKIVNDGHVVKMLKAQGASRPRGANAGAALRAAHQRPGLLPSAVQPDTLPEELRPYVPLFCAVLTKLGCGVLGYREQAQQVELKTGGMAPPPFLPDDSHLDTYEQVACLPGTARGGVCFSHLSASIENLPDMMHLWSEIFNNPRFEEEEHFRVLVRMAAQELSNGVPDAGHVYASVRAGRTWRRGDLQETFEGWIRRHPCAFAGNARRLSGQLARQADFPFLGCTCLTTGQHSHSCLHFTSFNRCSVNATPQQMSRAGTAVDTFVRSLGRSQKERKPLRPHVVEKPALGGSSPVMRRLVMGSGDPPVFPQEPTFTPCQVKTHFLLPFPVSYVAECVRTAPYSHPDHASLKVLARLMTAKFLHTEIREKGGAYGGGAKLSYGGMFTLYSYRDPRSTETLQSFVKAVDWARSGRFTQQDIDEAKLSVFSAVDSPVAPSDRGLDHFLYGLSDEMKQKHREQLFAVHREALVDVSTRYLGPGRSTHGLALLGPDNARTAKDPSWIVR